MLRTLRLLTLSDSPLTLADAKAHLRILHDEEDDAISAMVAAATGQIEDRTGRLFRPGTAVLTLSEFPESDDPIVIPLPPLTALTSISYRNAANEATTLTGTTVLTAAVPGLIFPPLDQDWPDTYDRPDAVTVTFACGMATADVPKQIIQGLKLTTDMQYHDHPWPESRRVEERIDALIRGFCLRDKRLIGITR